MSSTRSETIGSVVVLYFPSEVQVRNIERITSQSDFTVVVDNTPDCPPRYHNLSNYFHYIHLGKNYGIGYAQNIGISWLSEKGCKYCVQFDQDTWVPENYISDMYENFKFIKTNVDSTVKMVVPTFYDVNSKTVSKPIVLSSFFAKHVPAEGIVRTTIAISSGALVDISIYRDIGMLNQDLFVDLTDVEFCLRLHLAKYTIYTCTTVIIHHSVGKASRKKFLGLSSKPTNHSPLRRYYFARNMIWLVRTYFTRKPAILIYSILQIAYLLLNIWFFEPGKFNKSKMVCLGMFHGLIRPILYISPETGCEIIGC